MPTQIVIEITPEEQVRLRAELRRARRGRWLTLHIVLLLALHYSPSEIAAFPIVRPFDGVPGSP